MNDFVAVKIFPLQVSEQGASRSSTCAIQLELSHPRAIRHVQVG